MRDVIEAISPARCDAMRARRLCRGIYINRGPNFAWHIDGNDKLKPFGFAIHGAIDGWSRKVLWLQVGYTNKDPKIVCNFYMDQVEQVGIPVLVCLDRGTENGTLMDIQTLLRSEHNDTFSNRPVRVGSSVHNQRIEQWWGYLRRNFTQFYMSLFKDLRDSGILNVGDPLHIECLRFCFNQLLQTELTQVKEHWNLHVIRKQKNLQVPHGKPEFLYSNPEVCGGHDVSIPVERGILDVCRLLVPNYNQNRYGCTDEFAEVALGYMLAAQQGLPNNFAEALDLFGDLITLLEQV